MTKKQQESVFGNFSGTAVGESEVDKWSYPGIGYNASGGIFYVNETQVDKLTLTPLALRQSKEVTDFQGIIHRYPVKTPKAQMVTSDDVTYRLQVACIVDGEIFIFGARSWTARASWLNPRSGQWCDDSFETGIWFQLEDWIKEMKSKHGVNTTPLCWEINIGLAGKITVGRGKNTSDGIPFNLYGSPTFVGKEQVAKNEALYLDEDLTGWVNEWKKTSTETAVVEDEPAVYEEPLPEDIPF